MEIATQTIPKGYKQTEIGVIPVDWDVKKLKDIARYRRGSFPQPYGLSKWYDDVSGMPFIQVFDVDENMTLKSETKRKISREAQEMSVFVKKGSIVLTIQGSIGRIAVTQYDAYVDRTLLLFESFLTPTDNRYFAYAVRVLFEKERQSAPGGTIKTITKEKLSDFLLLLPPKSEQSNIADALIDMDKLIAELEKLIEKKKNLKQGAMQELLTGKRRLPGFNGNWETKKLGDLLDYEQPTKYIVKNTEYSDRNNIPVLTAGKSFILGYTDEEFNIFRNLPVIIFDDFTTATQFVDFPFKVKSSAMKILKPRNKDVDLRFVFEKMQLIDFKLGDHKRYWISEYQNIGVETPKHEEQIAIANVLSDMDVEIEKLEAKLAKYREIKQGMMQTLLTGKIRLK
ncbi:MAG: restriction endonuclease subunit S [Candidatus Pacebacteria bacterium]|nr:restriction endonuclease subunit S [Candidatus Paceibacterota bacterium]